MHVGTHDSIKVEMEGKPGVELITNYFEHDAVSAAEDNGMPGLRYVKLPDSCARIDPEMCKALPNRSWMK